MSFLFTALPFSRSKAWWIRIFDFPRAQLAVMSLISIALILIFPSERFDVNFTLISLLVATFIYQSSHVYRFTPFFRKEVPRVKEGEHHFSILQTNVRMENKKVSRLKKQIHRYKPDIISINEPDDWWASQLEDLEEHYPYSIKKPLDNTYGMILYSKHPLKNTEINFLVVDGVPSFFAHVELPTGRVFDLHCIHPEPPRPGAPTDERDTEILMVGHRVRQSETPAVIVGDLNDVAWSHTTLRFKKYCDVKDPRRGRGLYNTYNAFIPLFRYPLDHFFFTKHFGLKRMRKLGSIGSDHFPMFIHLVLKD
jgi:endonuclease/exonuclease/phosphatase (EEP) superfamily protein YafD